MSSTKLLFLKVFLMKVLLKNGKALGFARSDSPAVTLSGVEVLGNNSTKAIILSRSSDKIFVPTLLNQSLCR